MHEAFETEKVWKSGKHEKSLIYVTFHNLIWKYLILLEPERAAEARKAGVASTLKCHNACSR